MPARVALVERVAPPARLARTLRRCLAVPAGLAVTLAWRAREQRVSAARVEQPYLLTALRAVLVVLAGRAVIAASVELVAAALQGRAALVALALRAPAARVAVVARAALASMRAASTTVRQVVMPALAALVERAAQQARLARTPRRCLAVLAGPAVTPVLRALARRVSAA
jgi:hypothetical protein